MNKQPEVTAATRQKLIDAFWSLFSENEIKDIPIKAITARAGYNRGTLYQYFDDIYALIESEEDRLIAAVKEINPPKILTQDPVKATSVIFPFLDENADKISLLVTKYGPRFTARVRQEMYPFFLEQFGLEDTAEMRVLISFIIGGTTNALAAQSSEEDFSLNDLFTLLSSGAIHGFLPLLAQDADRSSTSVLHPS